MEWTTIASETLFSSRYVTIKKNSVELPDGKVMDDYYTVTIPDAASVVALTHHGEIILKREYRYACGETMLEIPAGIVEPDDDDALAVAQRELLEETGYTASDWTYLGASRESTSKLTNTMHLFLARDCRKVADQHLDDTEQLDVVVTSFDQAIDMVMDNEICASGSAHAILKAARLIGR